MSGHSDLGIFNNFGASSIFTWALADIASAAFPASGYDIHAFLWILWLPRYTQI